MTSRHNADDSGNGTRARLLRVTRVNLPLRQLQTVLFTLSLPAGRPATQYDYMTGRGTVNIAVKTAWGCIVLAYSVIAWGILCSRREGSGVAVQATAMRRLGIGRVNLKAMFSFVV